MAEYTPQPLKVNYDFADPEASWSEDYFSQKYEAVEKDSKWDLGTKEGLESLVGAVGEQVLFLDKDKREEIYKGFKEYASSSLTGNILNNLGDATKSLDDRVALDYFLNIPGFEIEGNDSYNKLMKYQRSFIEINDAEKDKEKMQAYVQEMFKDADQSTIAIWGKYAEYIVQGEKMKAGRNLAQGIQEYGTSKLVKTMFEGAESLAGELKVAQEGHFEMVNNKKAERLAELGGHMTPYDEMDFNKSMEEVNKEFAKKYSNHRIATQAMPQMAGLLTDTIYQSIKLREEGGEEDLALAA